MDSKIWILIPIFFTSCFQYNGSHEHYIINETNDTLYLRIMKKVSNREETIYRGGIYRTILLPNEKNFFSDGGSGIYSNIEYDGKETDTVEVYRADTLVIKWGGPLREMDKSINHFYNKHSWEIEMGGHKNKWERGTFTIRESDIGVIEGKK